MLWQIKGATMYFTERAWPDFDGVELDRAIEAYQQDRSR
jgi:undecaprenyl diphosphate synthase